MKKARRKNAADRMIYKRAPSGAQRMCMLYRLDTDVKNGRDLDRTRR
jgi:hypothetical protein